MSWNGGFKRRSLLIWYRKCGSYMQLRRMNMCSANRSEEHKKPPKDCLRVLGQSMLPVPRSNCSHSEVLWFVNPCQWSCISGSFPLRSTDGMAQMLCRSQCFPLVIFWQWQPIWDSLIPLPPAPGLFQTLGRLSLPLHQHPQEGLQVNILSRGARSWLSLTFGFKSKVTVLADIWPDVCVRANVFLQHAGFLAANSTLLTYILPSSTASHIHILFVWFVPMSNRCHDKKKKIPTSEVVTTSLD